jgi:peptidoglycan/xylan/chitin deacetylase (PgdA/CDA1 family)
VKATENLIRRYKDQGYEFVTIPEMLAIEETPDATARV